MIYENILYLPEICNFQEAINVRLALRKLRNRLHPIKPWKYINVVYFLGCVCKIKCQYGNSVKEHCLSIYEM